METKAYIINYHKLPTPDSLYTVELVEPYFHKVADCWKFTTEEEMFKKIAEIKKMYPNTITAQFKY